MPGRSRSALLAHLILATTLGGFASLQAKQIAKGRTPRPLDEDGHVDKVWLAAMLQGGGLGIYGDFLFGEANRNGLGFSVGSMAGPGGLRAGGGGADRALGDQRRRRRPAGRPGQGGRPQHCPSSTFGTRAWRWITLVLWRLQEALSPGYLERYEQRVEESARARNS
jgi:hypothetical protein